MKIFNNFDIEKQESPETKLSIGEKILIKGLAGVIRFIIYKVSKAKTYGDIYEIANKIDDAMGEAPDNFEDFNEKEKIELINIKIKNIRQCLN